MPFNKELEDFAQAFSSGYSMTKSKEERESEALDLKHKQFVVDRDPIVAGQEDTKFGLDVEFAKGRLTDAEAARERAKIDQAHTDAAFDLDQQIRKGQISDADAARERAKIDQAHADEKHKLDMQLGGLQVEGAGLDITRKKEDNALAPARAKEANALAASAAAKAKLDELNASPESIARNEEIKKWELKRAKADTALQEANAEKQRLENANTFNFADFYNNQAGSDVDFGGTEAVPEGSASSTGVDPNTGMNTGAGPRIGGTVPGPTSAVDVPSITTVASAAAVPPGSPPGSEAIVGTFSGEGLATPPPLEEAVPADTGGGGMSIDAELGAPDMRSPTSAPGSVYPTSPKADPAQATLQKAKTKGKLTIPDLIDLGIKVTPEALKNSADMSGLTGNESAVDTPETDEIHANWLNGSNGADPATAEMVLATMDEATDGKLNPKERLMATIGAGYLYHSAKGDENAAKGYAIGMVEYGRHLAGQYSAFAKAAAHNGDPDATAMAAMRAYAHVGNGKVLDVSRAPDGVHFIAHITDLKSGKTILKQIMSPDEVMAQAMKTTPDAVIPEMLSAAGEKDETITRADAEVLSRQTGIPADVLDAMTLEGFKTYQQGEKNKADSKPKVAAISMDDVEAAQAAVNQSVTKLIGEKNKGIAEIFGSQDAMDNLTPVAADIMVRNTDQVVSSEQAIRATKYLVENGLPDKLKEYDENTWVISIPGFRNLKLYKGRADVINIMHDQKKGQDKLTAAEKKARADQDAADRATDAEWRSNIQHNVQRADEEIYQPVGLGAVDESDPTNYPQMGPEAVPTTPAPPIASAPPRRRLYVPPASLIPQNQPEPWYWRMFNN